MIMKIKLAGKSQKVHDTEYLIESSLYNEFPNAFIRRKFTKYY